jgi:hypothetical protein
MEKFLLKVRRTAGDLIRCHDHEEPCKKTNKNIAF